MGWSFRKSIQRGPVRVNVSKSGIGVSAGVKGARVGIGPRGPYVAGGVGGLYFRKALGKGRGGAKSAGPSPVATIALVAVAVAIFAPLAYLVMRLLRLCVTVTWLGVTIAVGLVAFGVAKHEPAVVVVGLVFGLTALAVLVGRLGQIGAPGTADGAALSDATNAHPAPASPESSPPAAVEAPPVRPSARAVPIRPPVATAWPRRHPSLTARRIRDEGSRGTADARDRAPNIRVGHAGGDEGVEGRRVLKRCERSMSREACVREYIRQGFRRVEN